MKINAKIKSYDNNMLNVDSVLNKFTLRYYNQDLEKGFFEQDSHQRKKQTLLVSLYIIMVSLLMAILYFSIMYLVNLFAGIAFYLVMLKFQKYHNYIIFVAIIYAGYATTSHLKDKNVTEISYYLAGQALTLYYSILPGDFIIQFLSISLSQMIILVRIPKEVSQQIALVLWNLGFTSYQYIQHRERKISYFLKQKQFRVDQLIKNNIFQQIILTQFESTTQQITIYEKNDQMNQLLNEKDLSNVKLCFESFVIPEEEQKQKDIHFQNLYSYIQKMHFEVNQQIQRTNQNTNICAVMKSHFCKIFSCFQKKEVQIENQLKSFNSKKRRKFSTNQKEFQVFKVLNVISNVSFYVRVKTVYLDCPLVMVIFENHDIVKNNRQLKKQVETNNLLVTNFLFEVSKKCEFIKWATKQKQQEQIEFFFSLLQNNIYSITNKQQQKKEQFITGTPLTKKRKDSAPNQQQQFYPTIRFKALNRNDSTFCKLNVIKLFNNPTQQNSNQNFKKNKISTNITQQSLDSTLNRQVISDINSFQKKSSSVEEDQQVLYEQNQKKPHCFCEEEEEEQEEESQSIQELGKNDIYQKENLDNNYQFSQIYKNLFQKSQNEIQNEKNNEHIELSRAKNEINIQGGNVLSQEKFKSANQFQQMNKKKQNNNILHTNGSLLQFPSDDSCKNNQNNLSPFNHNNSNDLQKYYNFGFNFLNSAHLKRKSFEIHKKQQKRGSEYHVITENKRSSIQLAQEIVMLQINQLNLLQQDKHIKTNQHINKNIQVSSASSEKEYLQIDYKDKEQFDEFQFQEIVQELNLFRKFVKIKIDQALLGLKIQNNKEAIMYVLKSFISSVIALNYIGQWKTKQKAKQKLNKLEVSTEVAALSNQILKNQEQVQNDHQKLLISNSSLINSNQANIQKSKEVSFSNNQNSSTIKNAQNNSNFAAQISLNSQKHKPNLTHQVLKDSFEDNKIQSFLQNTNTYLNYCLKDRTSPNNQEYKQFLEQNTVLCKTIDDQGQNKSESSNANVNKLDEHKEIQLEFNLEIKQLTKSFQVKIINIQKDELINCINFNSNFNLNLIEYEAIKKIIQKIGPQPLSYYQGSAIFGFLLDLNQINHKKSTTYQLKPSKSEIPNENLLIIPEEQETNKKSLIKLSPVN